jgi:hypothetical protein
VLLQSPEICNRQQFVASQSESLVDNDRQKMSSVQRSIIIYLDCGTNNQFNSIGFKSHRKNRTEVRMKALLHIIHHTIAM